MPSLSLQRSVDDQTRLVQYSKYGPNKTKVPIQLSSRSSLKCINHYLTLIKYILIFNTSMN